MKRLAFLRKLYWLAAVALLGQFGGCVTTNQLKDFIRTEIALVATQLASGPINDSLADMAGPQVLEEVVPSI